MCSINCLAQVKPLKVRARLLQLSCNTNEVSCCLIFNESRFSQQGDSHNLSVRALKLDTKQATYAICTHRKGMV